MQDLKNENYRALLKEIKGDLNKQRHPMIMNQMT